MTTVVNLMKEEYDIYIGRYKSDRTFRGANGYYGNPFVIGIDGTREESLQLYKEYFYQKLKDDIFFEHSILSLKGKRLGCFCKPLDCHGDIIKEYLDRIDNETNV